MCFYPFPVGVSLGYFCILPVYFVSTVFGVSSSLLIYILLSIQKKKFNKEFIRRMRNPSHKYTTMIKTKNSSTIQGNISQKMTSPQIQLSSSQCWPNPIVVCTKPQVTRTRPDITTKKSTIYSSQLDSQMLFSIFLVKIFRLVS